jgi:hypothetical protein
MARPERQFVGVLAVALTLLLVGGVVAAAVKDHNNGHHNAAQAPSPLPTLPGESPSASANPNVTPGTPSAPPSTSTPSSPSGPSTPSSSSSPTGPSGPGTATGPGRTTTGPQMPNTGLPAGVPVAALTLVGFAAALGRRSRS